MKNKLIFGILILLILPFSVSGALTDNLVHYYSFDTNANDEQGSIDGSATGDPTNSAGGILNNHYVYDGNDYHTFTGMATDIPDDFTISLWFKVSSSTSWQRIWELGAGNDDRALINFDNEGDNLIAQAEMGANMAGSTNTGTAYNDNSYHHLVFIWDDTANTFDVYVDNSLFLDDASGAGDTKSLTDTFLTIATGDTATMTGSIDELGIWSRKLSGGTGSEVETLYNSGSGYNPLSIGGSDTFQIINNNVYNGTPILTYNATINGTKYSTTNGTIVTGLENGGDTLYNIDFEAPYYFDKTFYNVNTTEDYTGEMSQTQITLVAKEYLTGNILQGTFTNSTDDVISSFPIYPNANNLTYTFTNSSYYTKTVTFDVPALFNGTLNITGVAGSIINVTVKNAYSEALISNFSGWAYNIDADYNESFSTTNGYAEVSAISGNYSIYAVADGYAIEGNTVLKNITVDDNLENVTFSLWTNNSLRINIYDETSNTLTSGTNISIVLTGNSTENTYYTTDGTYFLQDLQDGNYTLKFSGGNYTTKTYSVTVADRSTQSLNTYLSSNYNTVIFTISNSLTGGSIEGASFTVSRLINSTWTVTESKSTDVTGRAQVSYLSNAKYRYTIIKSGYVSKTFDLDPVIFGSYTVLLTPESSDVENIDFYKVNVEYYPKVFYNDEENNLTFVFSSPEGSLESYGFNIRYPSGASSDIIGAIGSNSIGETFTVSFNISGAKLLSTANITYWYDSSLGDNKSFTTTHGIIGGSNVLNNTIGNIRGNNIGGLGVLEKSLIAIFFVMILTGFAFLLGGLKASAGILSLGFGLFAWLGFVPLWAILPALLVAFILMVSNS